MHINSHSPLIVEVSARLTTSPCAVVATDWGWTGNMEKIMGGNELIYFFIAVFFKII